MLGFLLPWGLSRLVKDWDRPLSTRLFMVWGMGPIVVDPPFHSCIVSRRISANDLSITCCHLDPKFRCWCSAWRGYSFCDISIHRPMINDGMTQCCLCWSKDILQQSDRLIVDQISQHRVVGSLMAQQLMDILDQMVNLRVHQSRLCKLRDLCRIKLEYSLIGSIPGINPASRDNPTGWECWNTLAWSTLPTCSLTGLRTSPLRWWSRGLQVTFRWVYVFSSIPWVCRWAHMVIFWTMQLSCSVSNAIVASHIKHSCVSTSSTIICMQWRPWFQVNTSRWYGESFPRVSSELYRSWHVDGFFPRWFLVCETPHISVHYFLLHRTISIQHENIV